MATTKAKAKAKAKSSQRPDDRVRVLELRASNIKLINEVALGLDGTVHEIRGDAGQGKTTILELIEGAFKGLDKSMIRKGADKGQIELRLSNGTIKRIIRGDDKDVVLGKDLDGKAIKQVKQFLQTIYSPNSFRPLQWVQLSGGEARGRTERCRQQRDLLLGAIDAQMDQDELYDFVEQLGEEYLEALENVALEDVDFEQHPYLVCKAFEKACYEYRHGQNALAEKAEATAGAHPAPETSMPKQTVEELREIYGVAQQRYADARGRASNQENLLKRRDEIAARVEADKQELPAKARVEKTLDGWSKKVTELDAEITTLEEQIAALRKEREEAADKQGKARRLADRWANHEADIADLAEIDKRLAGEGEAIDIDAIKEKMDQIAEKAEVRKAWDKHLQAVAEAEEARKRAERYTKLVELFRDRIPQSILERAELPIDGLSIEDEQILVNGIPLHQLGTSEQIRIGVLVAAAMNPRGAFILVDRAESLGKADRALLAELAADMGLQIIMTYVDPDAEPSEHYTLMRNGHALGGGVLEGGALDEGDEPQDSEKPEALGGVEDAGTGTDVLDELDGLWEDDEEEGVA